MVSHWEVINMNKKLLVLLGFAIGVIIALLVIVTHTPKTEATVIPKTNVCHCEQPDSDSPFQCQTLNIAIPAAAAHLLQHDADYAGECQVEATPTPTCTPTPTEEVTPTPTDTPKDYCETLPGVQAEDVDCPEEEEPTPTPTDEPRVTPTPGEPGNPPTFAGSSTNPPGVCPINDIGNVANINVKTTGNKGELLVQWSIPQNADKVHIIYGLEQHAQHSLLNTPNDGNEVIRNLVSGKHYWFAVAGVRDCGVGSYSRWFDPLVP